MVLSYRMVKCYKCGATFLKRGGGVVADIPRFGEKYICSNCEMKYYKKRVDDIVRFLKRK